MLRLPFNNCTRPFKRHNYGPWKYVHQLKTGLRFEGDLPTNTYAVQIRNCQDCGYSQSRRYKV